MPKDCNYQNLIKIISKHLKVQKDEYKLQIAYQVKEQYPTLEIEDDSTLMFYMQLKNTESDSTKYPLCIIFQEK